MPEAPKVYLLGQHNLRMVVHRMPVDGLIPCCLYQTALLRGYFFFRANISVVQFGQSTKDL